MNVLSSQQTLATGMILRVVGSTFNARGIISVFEKCTLAGMTARMTQRSLFKKSLSKLSISDARVCFSPLPTNLTMPVKRIKTGKQKGLRK